MRIAYLWLPVVLLAGCVSSGNHLGHWEHKDNESSVRVALERGGKCGIFIGGKVGNVFEGMGGHCRYTENDSTIAITEIVDLKGGTPEKLPRAVVLRYEAETDTLALIGERIIRLARTSFK
jgi:hypothetical protein